MIYVLLCAFALVRKRLPIATQVVTPPLSEPIEEAVAQQIQDALEVAATPPQKRQSLPQPRWTLKRLVHWVKETFQMDCCRETLRKVLKRHGFSWKKARKLLNKADPNKRAAYLETLQGLLEKALHQECLLVYIDEAHVHLDTDEGYGWSVRGRRFWVSSSSPGRKKVSFYGMYLYNLGQVRILPFERANQDTTREMLVALREEFPTTPIQIIWDGAPYHRARRVKEKAEELGIEIKQLPAYSPDFMAVEHLWHWLREEVTYHTCYNSKTELIAQVAKFQERVLYGQCLPQNSRASSGFSHGDGFVFIGVRPGPESLTPSVSER